jgi:hypothetical protein
MAAKIHCVFVREKHRRETETTNRLELVTFWRALHHDGKFSPAWFLIGIYCFLLKIKAVNSGLRNRNMIGKILTSWGNSVLGNRKMARKNSDMVGNFPPWEKKRLPLHGVFCTAAPVV